tara:strand:- start:504 stop:965 length:462 start_codon:yes stop_codon:yes gene_type:complete
MRILYVLLLLFSTPSFAQETLHLYGGSSTSFQLHDYNVEEGRFGGVSGQLSAVYQNAGATAILGVSFRNEEYTLHTDLVLTQFLEIGTKKIALLATGGLQNDQLLGAEGFAGTGILLHNSGGNLFSLKYIKTRFSKDFYNYSKVVLTISFKII